MLCAFRAARAGHLKCHAPNVSRCIYRLPGCVSLRHDVVLWDSPGGAGLVFGLGREDVCAACRAASCGAALYEQRLPSRVVDELTNLRFELVQGGHSRTRSAFRVRDDTVPAVDVRHICPLMGSSRDRWYGRVFREALCCVSELRVDRQLVNRMYARAEAVAQAPAAAVANDARCTRPDDAPGFGRVASRSYAAL